MSGQRVGYVRVSTFDQNPDGQLENVQIDRVLTDKASGKDATRPELQALLSLVREGDAAKTTDCHNLSSMVWNHINLRDDYVWQQNKQAETGRFPRGSTCDFVRFVR